MKIQAILSMTVTAEVVRNRRAFLDDVLTTAPDSTYFNDLQGATKQLKDFIGLYLRENDMIDISPFPANIQEVGEMADQWLRYGCYCQLRDPVHGIVQGNGQPVDKRDEACQRWHKCHACTKIDDPTCDQRQMYAFEQGKGSLFGQYILDSYNIFCNSGSNKNSCQKNRCECDKELARSLYVLSGYAGSKGENLQGAESPFLPQFGPKSDGSSFDYANQCIHFKDPFGSSMKPAVTSNDSSPKECCGQYPNRFSYSTNQHQCCSDSTLKDIGGC